MFVEFMNLWFEKGIPLFSLELEFFILMLTSTDLHSEQSLSKRFILGDQWDNYFKLISVMKNDSPKQRRCTFILMQTVKASVFKVAI